MNWFKNQPVKAKLFSCFALFCAMMCALGALGISGMAKSNEGLGVTYERDMISLIELKDARFDIGTIRRLIRDAILATDARSVDAAIAQTKDAEASVRRHLDAAKPKIIRPELRAALVETNAALNEYMVAVNELLGHTAAKRTDAAREGLPRVAVIGKRVDEGLTRLAEGKAETVKASYEDSNARFARDRTALLGGIAVSLLLAVVLGMWVGGMMSRPLVNAVTVLEAVAQGDFTQHIEADSKDETGQMANALNKAVSRVRSALDEVRGVSENVSSAAQQLAAAAEDISTGAQQQASSLEETAASLEEITATVKQNADNAQQASQVARGSRDVAEKGGQVVEAAVGAMSEISRSSKKIADIITTIDEIAFQTNILALNAAVEAARAGEQGRGFAVVAAEVRNLAKRSAMAAKEIKGLIGESVHKVDTGVTQVNESGRTLGEIVASVKRVTDIIGEIASASREQNSGVVQVNKAVSQMDEVTQRSAAQTEELSGTAEGLAAQADKLQRLVGRFKLDDKDSVRAPNVVYEARPERAPRPPRRPPPKRKEASRRVQPLDEVGQYPSLPPASSDMQNGASHAGFEEV